VYSLNTVLVGAYPLNTVLVGEYPLNTVNTPYSLNTYLEGPLIHEFCNFHVHFYRGHQYSKGINEHFSESLARPFRILPSFASGLHASMSSSPALLFSSPALSESPLAESPLATLFLGTTDLPEQQSYMTEINVKTRANGQIRMMRPNIMATRIPSWKKQA
jgi:hypothetical protein